MIYWKKYANIREPVNYPFGAFNIDELKIPLNNSVKSLYMPLKGYSLPRFLFNSLKPIHIMNLLIFYSI